MDINALMVKWDFTGNDWITSVDTVKDKYICIGSRNGEFYILNWFGAVISKLQFDSWIGAMKVIANASNDNIYILIGTKYGSFHALSFNKSSNNLKSIFTTKFNNTIREIDINNDIGEIEDINISIASEDKNIYFIKFIEIVANKNSEVKVVSKKLNGWIRSVAFIRGLDNEFLIAAGCGDKYLYLFSGVDLVTEKTKVFVNSKIHSILSDKKSHIFFATSDAKKLFVISPKDTKGKEYTIEKEINLPHRATKISFADENCKKILILCDNNTIYIYDISVKEIINAISLKDKAYSVKGSGSLNSNELLIGHGQNSFSCLAYSNISDYKYNFTESFDSGNVEFNKLDFNEFSLNYLFGTNDISLNVGIGRFLHIVTTNFNRNTLCLIGTDEGFLKILDIETRTLIAPNNSNQPSNVRIWSIYGFWANNDFLKLFTSTSSREIYEYDCKFYEDKYVLEEVRKHKIDDWAREIRGISPYQTNEIIAACESGEIIMYINGVEKTKIQDNQIFRTVYANKRADDVIEILSGSDNNLISYFEREQKVWDYQTFDRVRETIIASSQCIAVSEDRFLYIINKTGDLDFRFKLPHRALCVDIYSIEDENYYVVGCGDGCVYFVSEFGYLKHSLKFPDRIRDIKVYNNKSIIVACEDLNVYICPTLEQFIENNYGNGYRNFIATKIEEIEKQVLDNGLLSIQDIPFNTRMVLLDTFEIWFNSSNTDIVITLLDSCRTEIHQTIDIRLFYIYASALINIASKIDFSIGKSRIEKYLSNSRNYYIHHSVISTISTHNLKSRKFHGRIDPLYLIEIIISNINLEDDWLMDEAIRNLNNSGFFFLGDYGFFRFYSENKIKYTSINKIISYSIHKSNNLINKSPLIGFINMINNYSSEIENFSQLIVDYGIEGEVVQPLRENINLLIELSNSSNDIPKKEKIKLVKTYINNLPNRELSVEVSKCFPDDIELNSWKLVEDYILTKIEKENILISCKDYLDICFLMCYLKKI